MADTSSKSFFGLAPKLMSVVVLVAVLVAVVITARASSVLDEAMISTFTAKGEAIALALAAAAERDRGAGPSLVQGAMVSEKNIRGVAYIYLESRERGVEAHTFPSAFPPELRGHNPVAPGALPDGELVQAAPLELRVRTPEGPRELRVIDIAAPISSGALGAVHVGIDRTSIDDQVRQLQRSMLSLGAGAGLLGIAVALVLVVVMVVRPVRELTQVTSDIVSKGDLTQRIQVSSRDEIGQLARTFSQMVEKLRQIPTNLQESTALLTAAVANLDRSTGEQSQTLARQAAALHETQATAQEIKQTSLVASQKAEAVLQVAERADDISRTGEAAIEQSLTGLNDIRLRVEEISQKILQLNERTLQIGGITQTVKDLADQSNMLALNAAIEAVRSGEHGKGFAVVAREIRSLADQSIKATERVREILDDIAAAIRAAVSITEKGASRMEAGLVQMKTSGENLKELSNIVRDNSAAVRQIAVAVNQQNAGITQIFTAVTDLSKMMEASMSGLTSTTDAASALKEVSERVSQMVRSYRL
jgi:methyl-accepting chemotaxis protein